MLSSIFNVDNKSKFERGERPIEFESQKVSKRKPRKNKDKDIDDEDNNDDNLDAALTEMELKRMNNRKERKPKTDNEENTTTSRDNDNNNNNTNTNINNEDNEHPHEEQSEENKRTIFVGNISLDITSKQLKSFMKQYGDIESIRMRSVPLEGSKIDDAGNQALVKRVSYFKKKLGDQKSSSNAYVIFKQSESVVKAVKATGTLLKERHLRIDTVPATPFDYTRTVFLGGLSIYVDEEKLREFFSKVLPNGQDDIQDIRLVRDPETLLGKGFGYLMLHNRDAMMSALKCHGRMFKCREMRVTTCGKRTKRGNPNHRTDLGKKARHRDRPDYVKKEKDDNNSNSSNNNNNNGDNNGDNHGDGERLDIQEESAAARRIKGKMMKAVAAAKKQKAKIKARIGGTSHTKAGTKKTKRLSGGIKKALKAGTLKSIGKAGKGGKGGKGKNHSK